jgi:ABC-2 type transport system ATP-binding protein
MSSGPLLEARDLHRRYGPVAAVDNVSLHLERGQIVGLLGPNGAGKSTTLKMLAGTLKPNSGSVRVMGWDMVNQPVQAKRHLGYLPERPPLYPELSVRSYLGYCAVLRGVPVAAQRKAIDHVTEQCELNSVLKRPIGNLSKGFQQRVGIAQALIHEPDVIILDEPSVGLDPNQNLVVRALIKDIATSSAVLLSTHLLPEVQALCEWVVIINDGKIVYNGAPSNTGRWRLRLNALPAGTHFDLDGVTSLQPASRGGFELTCENESALDAILSLAVEKGWQPRELSAGEERLEDIFVRQTLHAQPD